MSQNTEKKVSKFKYIFFNITIGLRKYIFFLSLIGLNKKKTSHFQQFLNVCSSIFNNGQYLGNVQFHSHCP